ncbi:MAG: hypothetical protein ACK4GR_05505, partial [bacterium]
NTIIDVTEKLKIIADQKVMNNFISHKYTNLTLQDDNNLNKKTEFYLSDLNSNDSVSLRGKLIVHQQGSNETRFKFGGNSYNFNDIVSDQQTYQNVKQAIHGELAMTNTNYDSQKVRDKIVSSISGLNYITLPAGWYVFVGEKAVVYFPPTFSGSQVESELSNNLNNLNNLNKLKDNLPSGAQIFQNEIKIGNDKIITLSDYSFKVDGNVKVENSFVYITSYGKDKNGNTGFGNRDIKVEITGGKVFYGNNAGVVIDGTVQGQGTFVVTKDPNSTSTLVNAMNYYGNESNNNSNNNSNNIYWQTYSYNQAISGPNAYRVQAGDLVARFDQLRGGQQNVAIVTDNNFIINPLSYQDNTDFFDRMIVDALLKYGEKGANKGWYWAYEGNTPVFGDNGTKIFQIIMDNPDNIRSLLFGEDIKSRTEGWKSYGVYIIKSYDKFNNIFTGMSFSKLYGSGVKSASSTSSTGGNSDLSKTVEISSSGITVKDSNGNTLGDFNNFDFLGNFSNSIHQFNNADVVAWQFDKWGVLVIGRNASTDEQKKAELKFYVFEKDTNERWNQV